MIQNIEDVTWKEVEGVLSPFMGDDPITWAPMPGSQVAFLSCPVFECLYEGTRGPGKTDALLMDFGQFVGKGWGSEWRGVLFRQTYPQLADVIEKTKKWFPQVFGNRVHYNEGKTQWTWNTGESLRLRFMRTTDDYYQYHGHSYPWMGWEELTTWPDASCYMRMQSCSRSPVRGIPIRYRSTTNPYGIGHNWVKRRWQLPIPHGQLVGPFIDNVDGSQRCAVHGDISENIVLLNSDPNYIHKVGEAARNQSEKAAWVHGSWDIQAGGMFNDIWDARHHVIPNVPVTAIPRGWRIDRSYDHGQTKPFSVGWWAESNGEVMIHEGKVYGHVPGDLFRIAEWYGWTGEDNEGKNLTAMEIAEGILKREHAWGLTGRVKTGVADSAIFDPWERDRSVAGDMARIGVNWEKSDKGPGSRKQGWEQIRSRLKAALPSPGGREDPGLFVCQRCHDGFIRTVPDLPRLEKDLDDVDTGAEDHVGDEVRYRVRRRRREVSAWRFH